ncbi:hsdR [Pantoea endophytica]
MKQLFLPDDPELSKEVEALISNGIDFLDKALSELESGQTKFSIVSFWTAVEILIKVPLVHEHWTLVCTGKKIVRQKYLAGDFQSVTYDEACTRLNEVLETPLPAATMKAFDIVRRHRNRVVHFYHDAFTEVENQKVLSEQADAWFALNRLMRDDWPELFRPLLDEKFALNEIAQLRHNEFYAAAKFRHTDLQKKIKAVAEAGEKVEHCLGCRQQSVITEHPVVGMPLIQAFCLVCFRTENEVEVACPDCKHVATLAADGHDFVCAHCASEHNRYDLIAAKFINKHNMYDITPAGCSDCGAYNSICDYADGFLCTSCFAYFDSLYICDHCGYYSSSVPEVSIAFGCNFCDGHRDLHDED